MPPAPAWNDQPSRRTPAAATNLAAFSAMRSRSGGAGQLGRARKDLARVADPVHDHDLIDVVALDLPGGTGEGDEIVRNGDDVVRELRVGDGEAQAATGGRAGRAAQVAELVGGGRADDGDVHADVAVLNGPVPPAVGAEDGEAMHAAVGGEVADGAVERALDVMDDAALQVGDQVGVAGEDRARKPDEVPHAQGVGGGEDLGGEVVAVAQVVVGRDHHAVAQARLAQSGLQVGGALVAVHRVVAAGADGRGGLAAFGAEGSHPSEGMGGDAPPDGVLDQRRSPWRRMWRARS